MRTLPFLYLPDAVTLILLVLLLSEMRKVAVCHVRQELLAIREEMIRFWIDNKLAPTDGGYLSLDRWLDSSLRLAPKLSPARLLFVYRFRQRSLKQGRLLPFPDLGRVAVLDAQRSANGSVDEKLRRLQTEMSLALGAFFLAGSVSGWVVLLLIMPKMIRRSFAHDPGRRIDAFFDMAEHLLSRMGRKALEIGFAVRDFE